MRTRRPSVPVSKLSRDKGANWERECANARFHRKGTFCKVCKKVITK